MSVTIFFLMGIVLASVANCQVFNITTDTALEVCESLPLAFSIMCAVDPAAALLWEVTGVTPPLEGAIARGDTVRSFSYLNVIGQSILNVNDPSQMDVRNQTCFICRAEYPSGNIARSDPLCVDVAGTPVAPHNVMTTHCAVAWTPSAPGLHHKTSVCLAGTTNCPIETSCIGCSSAGITGIAKSGNYSIAVCSSSVVNGVPCMSEACASTITDELSPPSIPILPSPATCSAGCTPDTIAGVAVGCLSLSLLLTAASVVITFLCTRRCYNKKNSPPSPNEKSVYYETVQSDSVQMQPSPAYQSVEQLK